VWWYILIAQVVVNPTTIRSWPWSCTTQHMYTVIYMNQIRHIYRVTLMSWKLTWNVLKMSWKEYLNKYIKKNFLGGNNLTWKFHQFEPCSWLSVLDTTLCDKVCQWLATGQWFSLGTLVSSINKTECHDIIEILLKVALNTINPKPIWYIYITVYTYVVLYMKEFLNCGSQISWFKGRNW
jgi:hypothetical protein